jgi:hypothetical protein
MIVTTTGAGPAVDSCAYAWPALAMLPAAIITAMKRVMTDLLVLCL